MRSKENISRYEMIVQEWIIFLLKKWWWLFLVLFLLGVSVGVIYSTTKKPMYESRLTFALDNGESDGGLLSIAAQFGFNIGGGQSVFEGDNIFEVMKSRRIIENVLLSVDTFNTKQYTLVQYYLEEEKDKYSKKPSVQFPVGINKNELSYLQDSILFNIYSSFKDNNIRASKPDKKLSIYEVRVSSKNEKFTKIFTDRLIAATDSYYIELSSRKNREIVEVLEKRVAAMKGGLNLSIDKKSGIQDANINTAFLSAQSPVIKKQYDMHAYGEAYGEMFKNLEIARFQYLKKMPLMQIIDTADYPMKRIKIGKMQSAIIFGFSFVLAAIFVLWTIRLYQFYNKTSTS